MLAQLHVRSSVALVALSLLVPCAGRAGVIFLDNFDTNLGQGAIASGAVDTSATGTFDVTSGNVDVVGPSFFSSLCNTPPETGSCIDMDGLAAGQITSTTISLAPGSYNLSFDVFGTERGFDASTTVTFGTIYSNRFDTVSGSQNIVSFNFTVASTTSAQIVFTSNDPAGDNTGTLVDNVAINSNSGTVPEPGSGLLLIGALPLVWFARRRRV